MQRTITTQRDDQQKSRWTVGSSLAVRVACPVCRQETRR